MEMIFLTFPQEREGLLKEKPSLSTERVNTNRTSSAPTHGQEVGRASLRSCRLDTAVQAQTGRPQSARSAVASWGRRSFHVT